MTAPLRACAETSTESVRAGTATLRRTPLVPAERVVLPIEQPAPARATTAPAGRAAASAATTTTRSTSVPAEPPARLLRCVGERVSPAIDVRDGGARAPQHVVRGRPLAPPSTPLPLPDPTALCCAVVRAALEVVRGERTVGQLARWVSPEIYEALARRARLEVDACAESSTRPVTIRRARLVRIGDGVAEGTVVVEDGDRVRAAAARLEARRGTWRVVALEIG